MALYYIFSSSQLIDFSNGKMVRGVRLGTVDHSETSLAVNQDEVAALNFLVAAGYTLAFINGWGSGKEFTFTHV